MVYFHHRIKHNPTASSPWDKGIEVKSEGTDAENFEAAKQALHAYLGSYAYGKSANVDYVACYITDEGGNRVMFEVWNHLPHGEPEPESEA